MRSIGCVLLLACAAPQRLHSYAVPAEVGRLVVDEEAFAELARPLRADAEADVARGVRVKDDLFILALLDALDGRWPAARDEIERVRALETDPALKAMTGLTIRVWADARQNDGDFRAALERQLAALPVDRVRNELSMLRTMGQVFSPDTCRQLVNENVVPDGGRISIEQAQAVAFQRYAVVWLVPVGRVIDEVLGARGIEPRTE